MRSVHASPLSCHSPSVFCGTEMIRPAVLFFVDLRSGRYAVADLHLAGQMQIRIDLLATMHNT